MAYINVPHHKTGTELCAMIRGKPRPAIVHKLPFVPTHYYKRPGSVAGAQASA